VSETDYRCDFLKPLDSIGEPDPRNAEEMPNFLGGGERNIANNISCALMC